ncbi:PadR family transcriptional regulator [Halocella sp. SP3-1]|uniref:PadR family transcriptional regulator n=1 Tax=Halocella sp. SP3-1 TaxID=2382161 RepID=UPI000F753CBE|nr:PadR family transcriptional regulator [Halocella sp. SP3-1]AZO94627.1 PadR family transcriptional regulator [Halocella sp. SP3-1]MTI59335.1 helix-turn-helix transcriptional regulator [Bacillota bacterium]
MKNRILRKMFLAFMRVHILHHAKQEPFFGLWMIEELQSHGYKVSAGTLYPILHKMEQDGILEATEKTIESKVRKYYSLTKDGEEILNETIEKAKELFNEIIE